MRTLTIAVCSLALAGCGGPETLEEALGNAADFYNSSSNNLQTSQLKNTKIKADVSGDLLTIRLTNFPSGTRTYDPNALRKLLREKLCEIGSARAIFDMGGKIRIELQSNYGKELPPVQVARC